MRIAANNCSHRDTVPAMFNVLQKDTITVKTVQSANELYLLTYSMEQSPS